MTGAVTLWLSVYEHLCPMGADQLWTKTLHTDFPPRQGDTVHLWPDFSWTVRRHYWGSDGSYACEMTAMVVDPDAKDQYGIPTLRFHWKWSKHETNQALHMQKTFASIIEAMGGRVLTPLQSDGRKAIAPGGYIIHEIGGAIMGANPRDSVVNQWGQSWDVKNLFLTDGAPFPSNADKNPTLSIMAFAWRAADYMLAAMKRREL